MAEAAHDIWVEAVAATLRRAGRPGDDPVAELSTDVDGVAVAPLYTGAPAGPPVRRLPAGRGGWDVRQRYVAAAPQAINAAIRADLDAGVTSAWLTDTDDLDVILDGVALDSVAIALQAGERESTADQLVALARGQGVESQLRGTLGVNSLSVDLVATARRVADIPGLPTVTVDGIRWHDAGAGAITELAVVLSEGVAALRALVDDGWSVDAAMDEIAVRHCVTDDQFPAIAMLRAARRLWARVAELSGASGPRLHLHAVTSAAMLTRRDPHLNIVRTTVAAFAAAVGGADAITTLPWPGRLEAPRRGAEPVERSADAADTDRTARRLALNTQAVLIDEVHLADVADAAAGSFYVDSVTEAMARAAWARFTELERLGGAVNRAAVQALVTADRQQRDTEVAHRRRLVTGVNAFARRDTRTVTPASGYRYGGAFEALRDRADAAPTRPVVGIAGVADDQVGWVRELLACGGVDVVDGPAEVTVTADDAAVGERTWLLSADAASDRADADAARAAGNRLFDGVDAVEVLDRTLTWLGA